MKQPWRRILAFLYFTNGFTVQATGQSRPGWLADHTEDTKLNHALKRVSEQALKYNEEMKRMIDDAEIDHQAIDERKVLLYNPNGSRARTAQGEKELRDALKALADFEFEIEPHYCSELPELPEDVQQILTGFVIKEEAILHEVKSA